MLYGDNQKEVSNLARYILYGIVIYYLCETLLVFLFFSLRS